MKPRAWLQHRFNALQVWAAIRNFADWIAPMWEKTVHPLLYGRTKTMNATKNLLTSKTFQGVLVTLLGLLWQHLGLGVSEAETAELAGWIVTGLGLAWTVYGRAKTKGERLTVGKGSGSALGLILLLSATVAVSACAAKNIAAMPYPEKARAVADMMLDEYIDLYSAFEQVAPDMQPENRAKAARALDLAKPAVVALADAALAWSETTAGRYDKALEDALHLLAQARNYIPDKE